MKTSHWALAAAALITACSTEPSQDVSGQWNLTESFTSSTAISCQATGDFLLDQFDQGARFTGQRARTVNCDADPGINLGGNHAVINGSLDGARLTFEVDFCNYVGMLESSTMSGTFDCPGLGQPPISFTGTWQARR